jgi:ketosteroid isomerase-like protein
MRSAQECLDDCRSWHILGIPAFLVEETIMREQQNVELVQQCYAAYGKGDIEQIIGCMTPDVDWELADVPGVDFSGKRHGCDQVREFFRLNGEQQTVRDFAPREFIAQGDKVVVLGHGAWTVKATGLDFESDWAHVFTLRDGKVAAFREFMDANVAVQAYQCYPLMANASASPAGH